LFARVFLYSVFPSGKVAAVGETATSDGGNEVGADGTFAFSQLPPGDHYFLRALARYDPADATSTVETIVGPLAVPSADPVAVTMRPVSLEVLQGRVAGASTPTTLTYASARVFDPSTGHPLADATVTFGVNGQSFPLPYGPTPTGQNGYFAALPAGTAGGTSFTFTTAQASMGTKTWTVAGELPAFDSAIAAPADGAKVTASTPLNVTWQAQPATTHTIVQLFEQTGNAYVPTFQTTSPLAPDATSVTIPADSVKGAGKYLLSVEIARAVCAAAADGCAIGTTTASANLTVQ
jgi:hypothetical protein